jgi:hypothetical protein
VKPEQREMQTWGKVSSIPGANTLFEGRQIKTRDRDRRDTEIKRQREETEKETEIEETPR